MNPSAVVPTLIPVIDRETGAVDESKAVWESLVTIDYIDLVSLPPASVVVLNGTEKVIP